MMHDTANGAIKWGPARRAANSSALRSQAWFESAVIPGPPRDRAACAWRSDTRVAEVVREHLKPAGECLGEGCWCAGGVSREGLVADEAITVNCRTIGAVKFQRAAQTLGLTRNNH